MLVSEFTVLPAAIADQVAPLASMSGSIESMRAALLAGGGAGAGTPIAGVLEDMTLGFYSQLVAYGAATDSMVSAVNAAAGNYVGSDRITGFDVTSVNSGAPAPGARAELVGFGAPAPTAHLVSSTMPVTKRSYRLVTPSKAVTPTRVKANPATKFVTPSSHLVSHGTWAAELV